MDGGGGVASRTRQLFTQRPLRNSLIKDNLAYKLVEYKHRQPRPRTWPPSESGYFLSSGTGPKTTPFVSHVPLLTAACPSFPFFRRGQRSNPALRAQGETAPGVGGADKSGPQTHYITPGTPNTGWRDSCRPTNHSARDTSRRAIHTCQ